MNEASIETLSRDPLPSLAVASVTVILKFPAVILILLENIDGFLIVI